MKRKPAQVPRLVTCNTCLVRQDIRTGRTCALCMKCKQYGITGADYLKMYREQKGECAVCGTFYKTLCIDHDHKTGFVRGLLCSNCNTGIGLLGDNALQLELAAYYLREANRRQMD